MEPKSTDAPFSILIVDDSAVVRRLLQAVLGEIPFLTIVGSAKDGQEAVEKTKELKPDFITLDVEMPNLSGLEALPKLREIHREVSVIMISSLTVRGAQETISALMSGAADYIQKPTQTDSRAQAIQTLRDNLGPKLKALADQKRNRRTARSAVGAKLRQARTNSAPASQATGKPGLTRAAAPSPPHTALTVGSAKSASVLAIGSSTGGPVALAALLSALPADFPLPIVVTQHMPPTFTRLLADRLRSVSKFDVHEAEDGKTLKPGQVWIAPGDLHMVIHSQDKKLQIGLNQGPPVNSCRPSIDVMLESLSEDCGVKTLTVILTGMGADGKRGCAAVHKAGGKVLVQDQESSVVWGMPGAVVQAGLAHGVLPLDDMAKGILSAIGYASRGMKAS